MGPYTETTRNLTTAASTAILIWTRVHGIVSLELTGIIDNRAVEAQRLIDLEINAAIQSLRNAHH